MQTSELSVCWRPCYVFSRGSLPGWVAATEGAVFGIGIVFTPRCTVYASSFWRCVLHRCFPSAPVGWE
ncbi:hypothetical protein DUNSADRAFT_8211 [Dunaliella salina]|uniref:Encoded protein n=1 Tax=Dunaliella salina TaxID=3046 RepID=A0ABQ7GJT9_DUNSA|nr:hypothetical protein DUNSADRAFT_8211 [Dunaliella salina]|eukprot:KAF5834875.1 hypothetical protein DUNSADRAFT_8211 [Dunaliella salina]